MYSEICRAAAGKISDFPYSTVLFFTALPFVLTYLITSVSSIITLYVQKGPRKPPVIPYWIPFIGHAILFVISPKNLALSIRERVRKTSFARLNFLGEDVHMVSGPDAIKAVFKSKYLESKPGIAIALSTLFGGPKECSWFYNADDSGIYDQPHPHSTVRPEHRIFYLTHKTIHDFFHGPGLASFCKRFQHGLYQNIAESNLHEDWTELPDLFAFLRDVMSRAAIEATAGPQLLRINPNFIRDLWQFDNALPKLFRGLPAWLVPRSWAVRQKCLDTIKEWRRYAEENFDESCIEQDGHDPYFGAPLMRWRNEYFNKIDPLTDAASASEDFGLLWAENSTSVPAACWAVLELFQDPALLREVREKIRGCQSSLESKDLEVEKLCSQPLLQSIFAEILRVRTSQFIVRADEHEDFHYGDWTVKKGKPVAIDTYAVHTDETVWSTGSPEKYHKVKDFWAQRFLTYPSDPTSGPLRKHQQPASSIRKPSITKDGLSEEPKFSTSSLTGAWIPFAGGRGQCPGRTFAKQEVILGFSIVCSMFDIELCVESKPQPDLMGYGLGGLRPKQKIPFRIRRRCDR